MNVLRSSQTLLIATVLGVGAAAVFAGLYTWMFLDARATLTEAAQAVDEAQLLGAQNANTHTVRKIVRDTVVPRERISAYFLTEEELVPFLEEIEDLGAVTGTTLTVRSVSIGSILDKDSLMQEINLTLTAGGTFGNLFYLLELLEVFPKALTVNSVRFRQHPDDYTWEGTFDVTVVRVEEPSDT